MYEINVKLIMTDEEYNMLMETFDLIQTQTPNVERFTIEEYINVNLGRDIRNDNIAVKEYIKRHGRN